MLPSKTGGVGALPATPLFSMVLFASVSLCVSAFLFLPYLVDYHHTDIFKFSSGPFQPSDLGHVHLPYLSWLHTYSSGPQDGL